MTIQTIEFLGETHEFPDSWNDHMIGNALQSWHNTKSASEVFGKPDSSSGLRVERTNVQTIKEYVPEEELFPELPQMTLNEKIFVDTIAEIETGGLKKKEIRTKVNGSGSSAYGRYQITHGLLSGTIKVNPEIFEPAELKAAQELIERQEIALAVGGSDIPKYREGGDKHYLALKWAKEYGYDNVDTFLDAFDYGGDLGLAGDADFQLLYEGFSRKMLLKQLKDVDGDAIEAASQWHGGLRWKRDKKHIKQTLNYQEKYKKILERRTAKSEEEFKFTLD